MDSRRRTSLAALGVLVILGACLIAKAGDILRGGSSSSANSPASAAVGGNPAAMAQLKNNAKEILSRAAQALQSAQALQQAARNQAQNGPNNLGLDPNHPGRQLSNVPNGLTLGGLQVAPGAGNNPTLWQGANLPQQSMANGQTTVTIQQTAPKAILNWQTFNVGKNTTAYFDQRSGGTSAHSWVALNRILDPSGSPSQILGSIKAEGQVYLINQNGIVFGGSSQVNVGALLASAGSITNNQFRNFGIYSTQSNGAYLPSFTGASALVIVQAGAQLVTNPPQAVVNRGGSVILLGSSVQNDGSIATSNGQTLLAAGQDFFLIQGYSVTPANSSSGNLTSTTLGTEIAVDRGGTALNTGLIQATTGDITIAGGQVVQSGVAISTSSVAQRGTIHLLTSKSDPTTSVTLAPGSITLIEPDPNSGTALSAQRIAAYNQQIAGVGETGLNDYSQLSDRVGISRIEITTGGIVNFEGNSLTSATAGQIAVSAGKRIFVGRGAELDVSGLVDVPLPMSTNDLAVNIQGFQLRDDPLNRDTKLLFNNTVYVDTRQLQLVPASSAYAQNRYYTAGGLLEVSGELNNVAHSINEWSTIGGTITLSSNQVVAQQGSIFNIAGGSIQYQGGNIRQSYFIGSDGRIYNVNAAPASIIYLGVFKGFIVDHPRWNVTEDFGNVITQPAEIYQPGYTMGRDAGKLVIAAPTSIFEGTIEAGTIEGQQQNGARPSSISDPFQLTQKTVPLNGSLVVTPSYLDAATQTTFVYQSNVVFAGGNPALTTGFTATTPIDSNLINTDSFSASQISSFVLGGLTVDESAASQNIISNNQGAVTIGGSLVLATGGQVNIKATIANITGGITARGGSVSINVLNARLSVTPAPGATGLALQSNSTIDTRGLWTNALLDPNNVAGEAFVNGGNVALVSDQGITLASGSVIDASSGGVLLPNRKTVQGAGGDITIQADYNRFSNALDNAPLVLAGTLRSTGFKQGGKLSLQAYAVLIGDSVNAVSADQPVLPTSFFSQGFSGYTINGLTSLALMPGAVVNVTEPVYQLTNASLTVPTGSDPAAVFGNPVLTPLYVESPVTATLTQRPGASLTLQSGINPGVEPTFDLTNNVWSPGALGGRIAMGQGVTIAVDPGQSVLVQSGGQITIDGTIRAPGGLIEIVNHRALGGGNQAAPNYDPQGLSIWLGSTSTLDVAARAATAFDAFGRSYGVVPNGGTIVLGNETILNGNLSALSTPSTDAFVIIRPGAVLDASGTSGILNLSAGVNPVANLAGSNSSTLPGGAVRVASNGGTIAISSWSGISDDGTLRAQAGGPGGAGGTFSLFLATPNYDFPNDANPQLPRDLFGPRMVLIGQGKQPSGLARGLQPGQADPSLQAGPTYVSADALARGGFANISVSVGDGIVFVGDVSLNAEQTIKLSGLLADTDPNGRPRVNAPYVLLGGSIPPVGGITGSDKVLHSLTATPGLVLGHASLTINADLLDIANQAFGVSRSVTVPDGSSLTTNEPAFQLVNFVSQGDIRFLGGTLISPGSLSLTAAQLYPVSGAAEIVTAGSPFNGTAFVPGTTLSINRISGVDPAVPWSLFGRLTLEAETINQGGVIRAPLGLLSIGVGPQGVVNFTTQSVNFLASSITSVSANGLIMPYGGTTDGVTYSVNGQSITPTSLINGIFNPSASGGAQGISVTSSTVSGAKGASIDLSGGGTLTGTGFISGRGGSVDVLSTVLANANPSNTFSTSGSAVYAIVPGIQSYAPPVGGTQGNYAGGVPAVGQQITVPAGIPDLPAGTYTLMPSNYALLPGAFRVEVGATGNANRPAVVSLGNGSYQVNGYSRIANTSVQSVLPTQILITPGSTVRAYSQYDEQNYSSFLTAQAARFGNVRPFLPADAKSLQLTVVGGQDPTSALSFSGITNFAAASGGVSGALLVSGFSIDESGNVISQIEITAPNGAPTQGWASVSAAAIDAIGAPNVYIGGTYTSLGGILLAPLSSTSAIAVRAGATINGAQVVLITSGAGAITLERGATINTLGRGTPDLDSSTGYLFTNGFTQNNLANYFEILVVSNGYVNISPTTIPGGGPITVSDGASLYSDGSIAFATTGSLALSENVNYGARYIGFSAANIDIGTPASLAAAQQANILPAGLLLDQAVLSRLLSGNPAIGAPALQILTLSASHSINLYGSVDLSTVNPLTGKSTLQELVFNTPAVYGSGGAGDRVNITTSTLYLNGLGQPVPNPNPNITVLSDTPAGPVITNGPGTGSGILNIMADRIVFGYSPADQPQNLTSLGRLVLGFSSVNLTGKQEITANSNGTLNVYQAQITGTNGTTSYTGGNLNLITPLLTGESGSVMTYKTGGALTLTSPVPVAPVAVMPGSLGAGINFVGNTITDSTSILAATGKVIFTSTGDINLTATSRIDVSGLTVPMFDQKVATWGGDVVMESGKGNIIQSAGSVINVSANGNDAGNLTLTATGKSGGQILLGGTLLGSSTDNFNAGFFDVRAQSIGDFTSLNQRLDAGGFYGSRSFDIKQGNVMIAAGMAIRAHNVNISVDGGSLIVGGLIDASGATPGSIRLSASGNLELTSSGVLDVHGKVLQVDSYGQAIYAKNRGTVELTVADGTNSSTATLNNGQGVLLLDPGATINLSSPDAVNRGDLELNVPRMTSATSGTIRIQAGGPLNISGAQTIAVNAFWTYAPADPNGTIVQTAGANVPTGAVILDHVSADSAAFIGAAEASGVLNAGLRSKLAGLTAYMQAFHLRPGVEIVSATPTGNLTVQGDLDLSVYRYASVNPNSPLNAIYGSGEPGVLILRAGGNLNIEGSINDGFGTLVPIQTPDDNGWVLQSGILFANVVLPATLPQPVLLDPSATTYPVGNYTLNYPLPIADGTTIAANIAIPVTSTPIKLSSDTTISTAFVATGTITLPSGQTFTAGQTVSSAALPGGVLPAGTVIGPKNVLPVAISISHSEWPAGVSLAAFAGQSSISLFFDPNNPGPLVLTAGDLIPVSASIAFFNSSALPTLPNGNPYVALRPQNANGTQGVIYPVEPMLSAGSLSWSMRLVSGGDVAAADSRVLPAKNFLNGQGNLVLNDSHISVASGIPNFSVIRTGTGELELLAGGNFVENSLYGIYTAGTQSAPILDANGNNPYNQPRGLSNDGSTILGGHSNYESVISGTYQAYYPDHGGNVLVSVQGNIVSVDDFGYGGLTNPTYSAGNWLWRQGGNRLGQPGAWWINFGTYVADANTTGPVLAGFTGIGALGGGNVMVLAGGTAGVTTQSLNSSSGDSLVAAIGSTGRVNGNSGGLIETGGGDITIKIGEAFNPAPAAYAAGGVVNGLGGGEITDVRGNINLQAASIGGIFLVYGQSSFTDPRPTSFSSAGLFGLAYGGPVIDLGDGSVSLRVRGDLVLGNVADPGRMLAGNTTAASNGSQTGNGESWFSLWAASTAVSTFSAGGNVVPILENTDVGDNPEATTGISGISYNSFLYPPILKIVASSGSIYFANSASANPTALELAPSPQGRLDILAQGSIYANALDQGVLPTFPLILDISGANSDRGSIPNPFNPAFYLFDPINSTSGSLVILDYNTNLSGNTTVSITPAAPGSPLSVSASPNVLPLFAFEADTATGVLHAGDSNSARIYAVTGDIVDLQFGENRTVVTPSAAGLNNNPVNWVVSGDQAEIRAGGDIVSFGQTNFPGLGKDPSLILNNNQSDVSVLSAGGDILYANVDIAGPGSLLVSASGNIYQGEKGAIESIGLVGSPKAQNPNGGASIIVLAGVGPNGPNWSGFADLYLNPANLADPNGLLSNQPGKVAETYQDQLGTWLAQQYGFSGSQADALAYFKSLPVEQQSIFLLQVYFSELNLSGLGFNDPTNRFYQTYVRGNEAIATLFPSVGSNGQKITYQGDLTMFSSNASGTLSDSSILTDFGGSITTLVPGGQTIVGVEGVQPGSHAGILTQGSGDINMYSEGSVLLGQSRILTTFGGNILIWSATGDINAGRGAKGTVIFTPPGITYDNYADINLAPTVPTSGAGIGTLNPIPQIPPGNVNLVAPLGTIDVGEAGIRVSGNLNLAARVIINAANVTVAGKATGLPTIISPNVAAITAASNTVGAANSVANEVARQQAAQAQQQPVPSIITVEVLGYGGG
jgi:filamentous hemagglutinin family protein